MVNAAVPIDRSPDEMEGPGQKPVRDAIIFVKRTVVKSVINRELQKFGVVELHTVDTAAQAVRLLKAQPDAMLVVDWEHGEKSVVQVLQAAQGKNKVDTRPIYFMATELSSKLVSIATDYNIVQVHIGEITPKDIQAELQTITSFGYQSPECQETFHEVARLRDKGEWKQAEKPLRELVEREPRNIRAGLELAENLFETGDYDEAADVIQFMLALDIDNMRALHLNARIMLKRGQHEQAFALLDDLCDHGAMNHDRLIDLGSCLMELDRLDEATKKFEAALQIDEGSQRAVAGKGQCQLLEGNINEAVLFMRQLTSDKELAAVFNNSAIHCMRRQHFEKGMDLYKSAIAQLGKNPVVQARIAFNMGIGFLRWGKRREACMAFAHSVGLDPEFTKAKYNMQLLSGGADAPKAHLATVSAPASKAVAHPSNAIKLKQAVQADLEIEFEAQNNEISPEPIKTVSTAKTDAGKLAQLSSDLDGFGADEMADSLFDELDDSYFQNLIES